MSTVNSTERPIRVPPTPIIGFGLAMVSLTLAVMFTFSNIYNLDVLTIIGLYVFGLGLGPSTLGMLLTADFSKTTRNAT